MLEALKDEVLAANQALPRHGLVALTWGNVSGVDRGRGLMVIKPSGLDYAAMKAEDMAVVDLKTGEVAEGSKKPSSDTPTHRALYLEYRQLGGIVHTHSRHATIWAQAGLDISPLGTTHADAFHGPVPCGRALTGEEIAGDYEWNTGRLLIETLADRKLSPDEMTAALARGHGPFTWGPTPAKAVENSIVLEEVAYMALFANLLNPGLGRISQALLDKHYFRKHGAGAYYGQPLPGG